MGYRREFLDDYQPNVTYYLPADTRRRLLEICRLRRIPVSVSGTVYLPLEVPQRIEECFGLIPETAAAIADPFEQAFFALLHLNGGDLRGNQ